MKFHDVWYWKKQIPHKTCQDIISLGEENWKQAQIYGSQENISLDGIRKSDIVWITEQWVYDLIWPYMASANKVAGWNYNITAAENCQVTRYTKDGFYSWHIDGMGSHREVHNDPDNKSIQGNARKLSMSIVLNSNFEGGDFEIAGSRGKKKELSEDDDNNDEEGSIIVFPSFIEHRVAPVTKGIRYSLVAWFVGPPFI